MDIFLNEHEVITIGGLNIENRLGSVVIYGDVEIGADGVGLEQAQALANFANELLKAVQDPANQALNTTTKDDEQIENPFL